MYTDNSKLRNIKTSALTIQTNQSNRSPKFSLNFPDETIPISINDQEEGIEFHFMIKNTPKIGIFKKTKLISIFPKFILINQTSEELFYRQINFESTLQPNNFIHFYFRNFLGNFNQNLPEISFKFHHSNDWSPPIPLSFVSFFFFLFIFNFLLIKFYFHYFIYFHCFLILLFSILK